MGSKTQGHWDRSDGLLTILLGASSYKHGLLVGFELFKPK